MSYDYSPAAYGSTGAPAIDPQLDLRSLDQMQGGQGYGAQAPYGAAPAAYQADGLDLRGLDEMRGGPTGRIPAVQMHERERGAGDFVTGIGKGFFGGLKDTVRGVALLGKSAIHTVTHLGETRDRIADWGAYAVQHPGQSLGRLVTSPFRLAGAIVQPYSDAVRRGQYGQVVGRLGFDVALTALTLKAGDVLRNGNAPTPGTGVGGDDVGGVMNGGGTTGGGTGIGGGAGRTGGVSRGGASSVSQSVNVGDVKIGNISNPGNGTININIGTNHASVAGGGGGSALGRTVAGSADDAASVMSLGGQVGDDLLSHGDDLARTTTSGGFFSRLQNQPWQGTRNISARSTFNNIVNGIDNGAAKAVTTTQQIGNAFGRTVSFLDRGLSLLHPDNALAALRSAGDAIVRVPRFVINNPGTSLKYAVAGTATAAYTAGQVAVAGARFVVSNPGHAAVLVAATGRTLGAPLVRDEQRSSATYDPDNPFR